MGVDVCWNYSHNAWYPAKIIGDKDEEGKYKVRFISDGKERTRDPSLIREPVEPSPKETFLRATEPQWKDTSCQIIRVAKMLKADLDLPERYYKIKEPYQLIEVFEGMSILDTLTYTEKCDGFWIEAQINEYFPFYTYNMTFQGGSRDTMIELFKQYMDNGKKMKEKKADNGKCGSDGD